MSFIFQPSAPVFPIVSGRQYSCLTAPVPISNAAVAAIDTIYFYPFKFDQRLTFTNGIIFLTAGGAGSSVKAGIWANSPISSRPLGAPLYKDDTGAATTGTGAIVLALGAGILAPNTVYWFGSKFTGTLPTSRSISSSETGHTSLYHGLAQGNQTGITYADTYSNANPTIAEAASFTAYTGALTIGFLTAT